MKSCRKHKRLVYKDCAIFSSLLFLCLLCVFIFGTIAFAANKRQTQTPQNSQALVAKNASGLRGAAGNNNNAAAGSEKISYTKTIAPIIKNRCAGCHQEGGIAPFALSTYEEVKKRALTIDAVIASAYMPPWKPQANYGEFSGERRLSPEELSLLRNWIKEGCPSTEADSSAEIQKSEASGNDKWRSGKPDLIISMDEAFTVPADGKDLYRCFVFPLNLSENKFVSHVEFHPGNTRVVHHALFFLDSLQEARKKDKEDPGPGFSSFGGPGFLPTGALGGWAPGNSMLALPDGVARLLRKNSDLVVQLHLHPSGKKESVRSEIGIYYSKKPPQKLLLPLTVRSRDIKIPANESKHKVLAEMKVPVDFDLLQATPHAHLLCKEIKAFARTPQGKEIPLIWIKNWDFNWQEQYAYKNPVHLPAGTVVKAEFIYDNSENNFANPNRPPKQVNWGEETGDEMALIFFSGTVSHNEQMKSYMQAMLMGGLKDFKLSGANPANAFKVMRLLWDSKKDFARILDQQN